MAIASADSSVRTFSAFEFEGEDVSILEATTFGSSITFCDSDFIGWVGYISPLPNSEVPKLTATPYSKGGSKYGGPTINNNNTKITTIKVVILAELRSCMVSRYFMF
jgi:hypothetical protein